MAARPPTTAAFVERLWPPPSWWALAAVLVAALAAAVGVPLGTVAGLVAAALGAVLAAWLLVSWAAQLRLDSAGLRAGRATLPWSAIARADALDAPAAAALRGRDADPRAYLLLRPWLPLAVRVDLDDADDPTPYWYVSTRHPAVLAAALRAGRADEERTGQDGPG